jgi:hypothetical protein
MDRVLHGQEPEAGGVPATRSAMRRGLIDP